MRPGALLELVNTAVAVVVPDAPPADPGVGNYIGRFIGSMKYIGIGVAVLAIIVCAVLGMFRVFGDRHASGGETFGKVGIVLGCVVLIGLAPTLVSLFL